MTDVLVPVGACRCPGAPHGEGDWVALRPDPTIDIGAAVYAAVQIWGDDPPQMQVALTRAYLRWGIVAWSFRDQDGPIAIAPRSVGFDEVISVLLPFEEGGYDVANIADGLYSTRVLRPLMTRLSSIASQGGQTAGSTSATPRTSRKRPTRSASSSPASTDGKRSADQDP